ncbi:hypothetical protein Glove_109g394 [Diversispora epigaea]|uniref:Uncharacterized protein n=1 Tax=Diversispora epigaea TaxID=1348612 RepID=A0A397J4S3_9GLOM|nr:hypothetical protein Glove_109g394 [Diversispora epigaea]
MIRNLFPFSASLCSIVPKIRWGILNALSFQVVINNKKVKNFHERSEMSPLKLNNAPALRLRGEIYKKLGKYNEASSDFSKALEKEPNNTPALRSRGKIYQKLKKHEKALTDFNKLLELDPNDYLALKL